MRIKLNRSVYKHDPEDAFAVAESIQLPRIDEASALPRPNSVGQTYAEKEYDVLVEVQASSWEADGVAASRASSIAAEGSKTSSDAATTVLNSHEKVVLAAQEALLSAETALHPFMRREPHGKAWYNARLAALVVGDIAGITGAAVYLGEIPALALIQAIAAGVAAVTAGVVGGDLKDLRLAAKRQLPDNQITGELKPFAHLFRGVDSGAHRVRAAVGVSVTIGLLIAVGIFSLRTSVEGSLSGLVFGCLAAAVAAASFLNSWAASDEVTDLLDSYRCEFERAVKRHTRFSLNTSIITHAEAAETARSVVAEHASRGKAAAKSFEAMKFGVLRRNPGVVGHGEAPETIGRTAKVGA
jgi:hypothetical protein